MYAFEIAHFLDEGIRDGEWSKTRRGFFPFCSWKPFLKQAVVNSRTIYNILPPSWQFIDIKWRATPSALKMTIWLSEAGMGISVWSLQKQDLHSCSFFFFFFNPHPRICLLIWETETLIGCYSLTGDQTRNLGMCPGPLTGLEPATFWCTGWHFNQLTHLARAAHILLNVFTSGN